MHGHPRPSAGANDLKSPERVVGGVFGGRWREMKGCSIWDLLCGIWRDAAHGVACYVEFGGMSRTSHHPPHPYPTHTLTTPHLYPPHILHAYSTQILHPHPTPTSYTHSLHPHPTPTPHPTPPRHRATSPRTEAKNRKAGAADDAAAGEGEEEERFV